MDCIIRTSVEDFKEDQRAFFAATSIARDVAYMEEMLRKHRVGRIVKEKSKCIRF